MDYLSYFVNVSVLVRFLIGTLLAERLFGLSCGNSAFCSNKHLKQEPLLKRIKYG